MRTKQELRTKQEYPAIAVPVDERAMFNWKAKRLVRPKSGQSSRFVGAATTGSR
jgi:hypothetical protein